MERDSVIEKIQALLNKTAERGATREEAELAASKVQDLLTKYNLSMGEVKPIDVEGSMAGEQLVYLRGAEGKKWLFALAATVATATFCHVLVGSVAWGDVAAQKAGLRDKKFIFIGREHNTKVATELLPWLEMSIWDVCKAERRALHLSGARMVSFQFGLVDGISQRLKAERAEQEAQECKVTALVIRYQEENIEYLREHYPRTGHLRGGRVSDQGAYAQGVAASGKVALRPASRQIEGGA